MTMLTLCFCPIIALTLLVSTESKVLDHSKRLNEHVGDLSGNFELLLNLFGGEDGLLTGKRVLLLTSSHLLQQTSCALRAISSTTQT
uniref:Uncharacterized protein n=1 Tax=Arion vulgaris TaxID=1028688 RepID=A0A0B6ZAX3_9EUPU